MRVGSLALLGTLLCAASASGERLPLTTYTAANGLKATDINAVVEDRQGFLWIGSDTGLWRFDGLAFRRYGREHGLTKTNVTGLAIAKDGTLWVGVWGGVFCFDMRSGSFVEVPIDGNRIPLERTLVFVDAKEVVWCVGDRLFRLDVGPPRRFRGTEFRPTAALPVGSAFLPDRTGNLWIGNRELYRVGPDGRAVCATRTGNRELGPVASIAEDRRGRIWVGTASGLWRTAAPAPNVAEVVLECVHKTDPARTGPVALVAREHGGVWMGSHQGIIEIDPDSGVFRRITRQQGLLATQSWPLLLDRAGDLWITGLARGLQRLAREGFTSYGPDDGLESPLVSAIWRRRSGELIVVGTGGVIHRYDGQRFMATRPAYPPGIMPSWGWNQIDTEDRTGQWWVPTDGALIRFPRMRRVESLARAVPAAIYRMSGCFTAGSVFRVYEDSRGNVWVATINPEGHNLHRWNRTSGEFSCFPIERVIGKNTAPTLFLDDGAGTMWIAFYEGQVVRHRSGRFECVVGCAAEHGQVNGLHVDRQKRLWIATARSGVLRIDNPDSARPSMTTLTVANGLSSNRARALAEDRFGRIYVGTDEGVDVLDDAMGRVQHFGVAEGLPHPFINTSYADANGDVWFGTLNGLARFTPPVTFRGASPALVLIDTVRVGGRRHDTAAGGESGIGGLVLPPEQRELTVDYVGLPRQLASSLRFQYRLNDREPWSPPSTNRSLVLAGLEAGSYGVEIRALDVSGRPSAATAVVSFRVLAPIYRRAWFVALAALALLGLIALAYRSRVRHLVALERQRTRIAMDLHDQMGSQLGSIALLADVAAEGSEPDVRRRELLSQIADTAADMGASLTEIVWTLRHDTITLERVAQYLTAHGRRLFPGPMPSFTATVPDEWPGVEMSPATGRNVLLIGLEAMHNCARHAGARSVSLDLRPRGRRWGLTIADDGKGMPASDPLSKDQGFGLETMRRRAAEIGADLEMASGTGHGTSVVLLFDPRAVAADNIG